MHRDVHRFVPMLVSTVFLLLHAAGCGGGNGRPDGGQPDAGQPDAGRPDAGDPGESFTIVEVSPSDETMNVAPDAVVSVTFNQALDLESAPTGFRLLDGRERDVSGQFGVGASPTILVFQPDRPLALVGSYTVRMTSTLKAASGARLADPYDGSFVVRDGVWTAPRRMATASDPGWEDLRLSSTVGFDGGGNAVAVWPQQNEDQRHDLWASTMVLGGTWTEPLLLEAGEQDEYELSPRVAVASDGSAVAIWKRCCVYPNGDALWFNTYEPGSGWSEPAEVPAPDDFPWYVREPALDGDGSGNVMAFWSQLHRVGTFTTKIWSATFSREKGWSSPELVEEDAAGSDVGLNVASGGDAMSLWMSYSGIRSSLWTGQWAPPFDLQTEGSPLGVDPDLAVSPSGHAIAVWLNGATAVEAVWASRFDPEQGWSEPERIDAHETGFPESARTPSAAIDHEGNARVVWAFGFQDHDIWTNRYEREKGWSGPEVIGAGGRPRVAVDSNGHAMAVWSAGTYVRFSRYVRDLGWRPSELLGSDDYFVASDFELVSDSDGRNLAMWHTTKDERVAEDWIRFTRVYTASFE